MLDKRFGTDIIDFARGIDELRSSDQVLDRLSSITRQYCELQVLAAALLPVRWGDVGTMELGKTVFLHKSAPCGWFEQYRELCRRSMAPGLMLAHLAMAPFTISETMRKLEPIGVDRWAQELALEFGIRDGVTCPVGGRWIVAFWSKTVIPLEAISDLRPLLYVGASFAAIQLQRLMSPQGSRLGKGVLLTPREASVLRLLSAGQSIRQMADHLGLGQETIRSHLKKSQAKLGVRTNTHAVAQAIRLRLIP
jgi:LuxR family quorum sensing-dependent transcriptional regulator